MASRLCGRTGTLIRMGGHFAMRCLVPQNHLTERKAFEQAAVCDRPVTGHPRRSQARPDNTSHSCALFLAVTSHWIFTFIKSAESTMPISLLPSTTPYRNLLPTPPTTSLHTSPASHTKPLSPVCLQRLRKFQNTLCFDPTSGDLSLRRI